MDSPLWFKDALIYELHVRSFYDSVGDGMGDFGGLTQKLDYLQDLGITAIWLLPFYPSPLKDDGYDIADYKSIHSQYGTLDSFREFLNAAHQRGLKVITELVLNHTSDQHPWFQRARRSPPGSPERDFYVWSDTPDRYVGVPIVFKDFESSNWAYDSVAGAYYWHRFYSHQPDLNFDNPAVRQAMLPIVDFWFEMGVDGMRLDAVPYLFEREGTTCAGLPETHEFLRELRAHVDEHFPNRMLLAEANVWPEEAISYFGRDGDECHMAFHFPLMPRLFMAMFREDRVPIVDIMQQTPAIPDTCQWALFLRNHDELTLEMVTDEERDSMYRAYARDSQARINSGIRRRLAPLLSNNRRRIELLNGLLFSLPGTPVIYYGDEIGMGDNIFLGDRNSVRTPMQWSSDRNAGFSRTNPQKLFLPITIDPEYHYESVNVEAQQNNPHSLLWWMKRLIDIRKRTLAFSRGTLEFLHPANRKVLVFLRRYEGETVLVLANLSRFVQYAQLDLSAFEGQIPVELFGGTRFPTIGKAPYFVMLGPHTFYWFKIVDVVQDRICSVPTRQMDQLPLLSVRVSWTEVTRREDDLWKWLVSQFLECRLLGSAAPSAIRHISVYDSVKLSQPESSVDWLLLFVDVTLAVGEPQRVVLPLTFAAEPRASDVLAEQPASVLARIVGGQTGILFDPLTTPEYATAVLDFMAAATILRSQRGSDLSAWLSSPLHESEQAAKPSHPKLIEIEQFNVSAVFENRLVLKLLTHIGDGPHPEVEVGQFLARCGRPCSTAKLRGIIELKGRRQPATTIAILHEFIVNEGDAWQYALDALSVYFERVVTRESQDPPPQCSDWRQVIEFGNGTCEELGASDDLIGEFLDVIRLLALRTAELHTALASDPNDPEFAPEPFTLAYQRSIYQAMRGVAVDVFDVLEQALGGLAEETKIQAASILGQRTEVLSILHHVVDEPLNTVRIRCHGDFHLGQVLLTVRDCAIIDFEGKPQIPISERRIKRSPLRDVATMLRSIEYAARTALMGLSSGRGHMPGTVRSEDLPRIAPWFRYWQRRVSAVFLASYLQSPEISAFLPSMRGVRLLLDAFLTERCLLDIGRELHDRPEWLSMALSSAHDHIIDASPNKQIR